MKKIWFFVLFLVFSLFLFSCQLKENYALQYGFSPIDQGGETVFESLPDGVRLETPLKDFSCDVKSFKAEVRRQINEFILVLNGTETKSRCDQQFFAEISGVGAGNYSLKLIYNQAGNQREILNRNFSVQK